MTTIEALKSQARRLRTHLSANKIPFTYSQSLEAIAAMHGHRDWNTATAALSKAAPLLDDHEEPLLLCITPESELGEMRAEVKNLLCQDPAMICIRVDAGITAEQERFARSAAFLFERCGCRVEFDSPL